MNDYEDINKLINYTLVFGDGRRYKILAGARIDRDYVLAASTSPPAEVTVFEVRMDNGKIEAGKYEGKNYDDIFQHLLEKASGLTECDETEETPSDTQERPVAQSITSVQRATSVKRTMSIDRI